MIHLRDNGELTVLFWLLVRSPLGSYASRVTMPSEVDASSVYRFENDPNQSLHSHSLMSNYYI